MESSGNDSFAHRSSSRELSIEQEFIVNKTLLTHDPDGRRVDCKILFQAIENVLFYASNNSKNVTNAHNLDTLENFDLEEASTHTIYHTIYKISRAVLCECHNNIDMHTKTLVLLEMLGHYKWDAKVVLLLAAFSMNYGEFRLVLDVYACNSLAASLAILKNLSYKNFEALKPQLKAMEMLVKEMVELTKCVVRFEGLPLQLVLYDDHDCTLTAATRSQIYLATYWIFRSSLISISQITDLIAMKQEQVNSNITTNVAWGLSSLALRLSRLCSCLRMQVDASQEQTEQKLYKKLRDLLKDHTQVDNQEVLHLFFSLHDDLPLKDCSTSEAKVGISKLKNKVVVLLVSRPDLLPIDQTLLLLHQTHNHPRHNNIEKDYEIVWVPIASSETWSLDEHVCFDYLSNRLPWFTIRQPWLLNSVVIKMIKEDWKFKEEPLMVALDSQGAVSNYNAIDMVLIWGAKAFPFSCSREKELWEEEDWNVNLMLDGIDRFLMKTMDECENICICGGSSLDWIQEFESRIKKLKNAGLKLQVIYVGSKNSSENMRKRLAIINKDITFNPIKIRFFWLRFERIKDSIIRVSQRQTFANYENILKQVSELLDIDDKFNDNWVVFGCGSSKDFLKIQGKAIIEFFDRFPTWVEKVASLGFLGAIRSDDNEVNNSIICDHSNMVPYNEGMIRGTVVCEKCKRKMKQYVVYRCDGSN